MLDIRKFYVYGKMTLGFIQILLLVCIIICGVKFHEVQKMRHKMWNQDNLLNVVDQEQLQQLDMSFSILMSVMIISLVKFFFVAFGLCMNYIIILFISFVGDSLVTGLYAAHIAAVRNGFKAEAACGTFLSFISAFITIYLIRRIRLADI
jgi:hypothetical protein